MKAMKTLMQIVLVLLLASTLIYAEGSKESAGGSADKTYEMSISYGGASGGEDDISAKEFKKRIEEKSNGRIEVKLYGNEQLGKEVDIVNMLELGNVDMAIMGTTVHQQAAPEYNIWSAYYIFKNSDEVMHVLNGSIGDRVEKAMLDNKGIRIIGYGLRGPRHLTSLRPIRKASEVQGLKIRIPLQPIYVESWKALGAQPQAIAYGELYMALRQGIVEAQENPLAYIYAPHFDEVQDYVNQTAHQRAFFTYVVSEKFFQKLPADLQDLVIAEGEGITQFHNDLQAAGEMDYKKKLQEKGMEFIEVDVNSFQQALKDIPNQFADSWVPGLYDDIKAEIANM